MAKLILFEIWRWTQLLVGWLLVALSPLIGGPLPGPFGIIGFAAGLVLVLRNSRWARRLFIRIKRRYPVMVGPVRHALRPGANLPAILRRTWERIWAHLRRRTPAPGTEQARTAPKAVAPPDGRDG